MTLLSGERRPVIYGPNNPIPLDWESFQPSIAAFDAPDQSDIELAFQISEAAHSKQKRADGSPYFGHPLGATDTLLRAGCRHREHILAGLLHDVPEDTTYLERVGAAFYRNEFDYDETTQRVNAIDRLSNLFGRRTAELVAALTKPAGIEDKAKLAREYRRQMFDGPLDTGIVKMADTINNGDSLGNLAPEKRQRKILEYEKSEIIFLRAIKDPSDFQAEGRVLHSWYRQSLARAKAAA